MEKVLFFASEQWLLISALAAAVWALIYLDHRSAGASLSAHALTEMVNNEQAVVIDLREKADFDQGHIVGAVNVPYSKWQSQQAAGGANELAAYKERPIVLVCKMGQHSSQVARKLKTAEYSDIYRLSGGLAEWQNAQMPLIKG